MARRALLLSLIPWALSCALQKLPRDGSFLAAPVRTERGCRALVPNGVAHHGRRLSLELPTKEPLKLSHQLTRPLATMDDPAEVRKELAERWRKRKRTSDEIEAAAPVPLPLVEKSSRSSSAGTPNAPSEQGQRKPHLESSPSVSKSSAAELAPGNSAQQGCEEPAAAEKNCFDLLTWNVDGLDQILLKTRSESVAVTINERNPAIVFLQEVVPASLALFRSKLSSTYDFVVPMKNGKEETSLYFCIILVCKKVFAVRAAKTKWFDNSMMGRHLLVCKTSLISSPSEEMIFLTSHLESMKNYKSARQLQLAAALEVLEKQVTTTNAVCGVFGGDLNIRDAEIPPDCLSSSTHDVWMYCGSPSSAQYTWDCLLNDNLQMGGKRKPRLRFDRLYWRESLSSSSGARPTGRWAPNKIALVGTRRLPCGRFESDHFGLLSTFRRDTGRKPESDL